MLSNNWTQNMFLSKGENVILKCIYNEKIYNENSCLLHNKRNKLFIWLFLLTVHLKKKLWQSFLKDDVDVIPTIKK